MSAYEEEDRAGNAKRKVDFLQIEIEPEVCRDYIFFMISDIFLSELLEIFGGVFYDD